MKSYPCVDILDRGPQLQGHRQWMMGDARGYPRNRCGVEKWENNPSSSSISYKNSKGHTLCGYDSRTIHMSLLSKSSIEKPKRKATLNSRPCHPFYPNVFEFEETETKDQRDNRKSKNAACQFPLFPGPFFFFFLFTTGM